VDNEYLLVMRGSGKWSFCSLGKYMRSANASNRNHHLILQLLLLLMSFWTMQSGPLWRSAGHVLEQSQTLKCLESIYDCSIGCKSGSFKFLLMNLHQLNCKFDSIMYSLQCEGHVKSKQSNFGRGVSGLMFTHWD